MAQTTEEALLGLLRGIYSTSCIHVASSHSRPITSNPIFNASMAPGNELQTMTLLLREAHSASLAQLVEFLLQLLLSHPPFKHTSPELLVGHRSRFLAIWKQGFEVSSTLGNDSCAVGDDWRLTYIQGLNLLGALRLSFQKLAEEGFKFVSELLLSCLYRLSLDTSSSRRNWVNVHKESVDILSELLHSVPTVGWLKQQEDSKHISAAWSCLQLLTSGAAWWGKSEEFGRNLERLARRFFVLPTTSPLLWGALRVDLKPTDIHSTLSLLLAPLERLRGLPVSEEINAFTPTPFNFPLPLTLDRHDFTKAYEFANLRVLFVAWVNADPAHRESDEYKGPWGMDTILQHTDAYKRLKLHPESAARVALGYIFNEVQLKRENFKPSTDLKAIELLKAFISHRNAEIHKVGVSSPASFLMTENPESRPESCIIMNAEWVLPWMWRRRNTDLEFVMLMTSTWMFTICREGDMLTDEHPMARVMAKHHVVLEVFNDFFRHLFLYDFISSTRAPKETLGRICRLLVITLQIVSLFSAPKYNVVGQQLYAQVIRCFVDSVDQEWISNSCWALVCEIFAKIPRATLIEAFKFAQVVKKMDLFMPVFLREIETVTSHCENYSVFNLPTEHLATRLESLTVMLQFVTLIVRANSEICSSFVKNSHFIASMLKYADRDYKSILIASSRPELVWIHAASVGAVCEIIIATKFGPEMASAVDFGVTSVKSVAGETKDQAAMKVIVKLTGHTFEMPYVISPLCGLVAVVGVDAWKEHQFTYLDIFSYIRMVLLQHEAHKWCCLFPVFIQAITALLHVDTPIRQVLLENRWNLDLAVTMLTRIKNDDMCCNECGVDFSESILTLVALLVERRPAWCRDLLKGGGMGRYSMLTSEILEGTFEKFLTLAQIPGEGDKQLLGELVVRVVEAYPEWEGKVVVMKRKLDKSREKLGKGYRKSQKKFYRIYRPTEGVPFCLVPC